MFQQERTPRPKQEHDELLEQRREVGRRIVEKYLGGKTDVTLQGSLRELAKERDLDIQELQHTIGISYDEKTNRARLSPPVDPSVVLANPDVAFTAPGVFENPTVLTALVEGFRLANGNSDMIFDVLCDACDYVGIARPAKEEFFPIIEQTVATKGTAFAEKKMQPVAVEPAVETTRPQQPGLSAWERFTSRSPLLLALVALLTAKGHTMEIGGDLSGEPTRIEETENKFEPSANTAETSSEQMNNKRVLQKGETIWSVAKELLQESGISGSGVTHSRIQQVAERLSQDNDVSVREWKEDGSVKDTQIPAGSTIVIDGGMKIAMRIASDSSQIDQLQASL